MNLVFIYGAPATGKLTVATELSRQTGYKLFHNHLTVDLLRSLFDFGTEPFNRLSSKFRLEMFQEAAKARIPGVIFTFVYAKDIDDAFISDVIGSVTPYGGTVQFVLLRCEQEELIKRVGGESRKAFRKIQEPGKLKELIERHDLFSPVPHQESLIIDNTQLDPQEVTRQIIGHYSLP